MQEHPVPRQITTFEFKLIGELTIKQFGYLAFGVAAAVMAFFLFPKFFYINFIGAAIPALLGIGFAFVPVNERPMDIWLKNLFKRLVSPTQYYYHKFNHPPKILLGLQLPPREVLLQHVKAQQSLNEYLQKKPKTDPREAAAVLDEGRELQKKNLQALMTGAANMPAPSLASAVQPPVEAFTPISTPVVATVVPTPATVVSPPKVEPAPMITFGGKVFTPNGIPLPNIMVYVKKGAETVRLFKTDREGTFQNNLPLEAGDYFLEIEDPQKKHSFARMKIEGNSSALEIFAES